MDKYRAALFMAVLALLCMAAHLWFGWQAFIEESATHGETAQVGPYLVEWTRDTTENLQSEFWQLAVQFALLAGVFRFMRVHAYEEDIDELKSLIKERT